MGKLTADQVREIRQLLMAGVAQKAIAKGYGVRDCTISNIKRGRSWYWLD